MTEFTSADGLFADAGVQTRRRYLTFYDDEHPIGAQLFWLKGGDALAEAARIVQDTWALTWLT